MKKLRKLFATLLTMAMLVSMGTTAFAAEAEPKQPAVAESTAVVDAVSPEIEVAPQANGGNEDDGIMPLGIGGYAAKYTDPQRGTFYVDSPGTGNGSGTFQITTHEFPGNPKITAVLYRPDGSYATQIYIDGNGTKKATFSNAVPGTYKVVYGVEGTVCGWISAWVSS